MLIIGLTGSIGMGKSTTAAMFRDFGVPVYDADASVHAIYAPGGAAIGPVGDAFPGVIVDGAVDRARLSAMVVGDQEKIKALEAIVHPLLRDAQLKFIQQHLENAAPFIVLDIPLLFETGGDKRVDKVVVVSAPADVQRARVLARHDMTEAKLDAILARQLPDAEKRVRADFVIDTGSGLDAARDQVKALLDKLRQSPQIQTDA
jgi:dephospho-CoA kinase